MAAAIEPLAQFNRDLRSAERPWKRDKNSTEKWSRGFWPSPGVVVDQVTGAPLTGSEGQHAKVRPRNRYCDIGHQNRRTNQNFVKMRKNYDTPCSGRFRAKLHAAREVDDPSSRSLSELPPITPYLARRMSATDDVLYSFDRKETPGRPLTLDIFVKKPSARDTERLVEKEYEILDTNGEALKGRKARRNLRKTASELDTPRDNTDDENDGFELV